MHVVVVGAGIVGVTSAYYLRRAGFEVTVVERRGGVAQETSFANGGFVAPAYASPWAAPGMRGKALRYLFREHSPLVLRPRLSLAQWRWLLRFWSECTLDRYLRNRARMQRLAYYSRDEMRMLRTRHALEYEQSTGVLQLFRTAREIEGVQPTLKLLTESGVPHALLDAEQCRAREAAIHPGAPLTGGLYLPEDETGNCAFFAHQLKDLAAAAGVDFRFDTGVERLLVAGGAIQGVRTGAGEIAADAVVVAAGVDSVTLLKPHGIRLPLYPVKGYSATVPIGALDQAPFLALVDETYKVVITRLGNRLRLAGTAEIGSPELELRESALATLLTAGREWLPYAASWRLARYWVGARPMLPDGPPVLGASPVKGLYLNLGHGGTGWGMAAGSARVVSDLIAGRKPEIDLEGLTIERYAGR
ncbi:MAG TPA: D-amino acid dehydrogenase [Burkholderiaceae bacterium]|jgi:D-amino-acid dehydrogenase|nr:D-amino acid dehydrogenase [Burkholderiaceae bacterium]